MVSTGISSQRSVLMDLTEFDQKSGLKAFDAFPKIEKSYKAERTTKGAVLTISLSIILVWLILSEFTWYFSGFEQQQFHIEREIKEHLDINVDITVTMPCDMLDVNVQDITGDRILADKALTKSPTTFDEKKTHHLNKEYLERDLYDLQKVIKTAKLKKKLRPSMPEKNGDACRIYGTMQVHHAQGDFHITAEGVGYATSFFGRETYLEDMNFTHVIDELSFGAYYPKLLNPLDGTHADSETRTKVSHS